MMLLNRESVYDSITSNNVALCTQDSKTKKMKANAGKCSVSVLELSNLLPNGKETEKTPNKASAYNRYDIVRRNYYVD